MSKKKEFRMSDISVGDLVKLKPTLNDWKRDVYGNCADPGYNPGMSNDLGRWVEVISVNMNKFTAKSNGNGKWGWPCSMIEDVDKKRRLPSLNPPFESLNLPFKVGDRMKNLTGLGGNIIEIKNREPKWRCKMDDGKIHTIPSEMIIPSDKIRREEHDSIPVEREKVKELLKLDGNADELAAYDTAARRLCGEMTDTLIKEIEEEKNEYEALHVKLDTIRNEEGDMVATVHDRYVTIGYGFTPEIHQENGKYYIRFKDEAKD